ncbi:unnamed protein product [Peniophora sp. CBMAI 1063]|nr:unnamed protein product [Peniophora sp. CBMAI 1063]
MRDRPHALPLELANPRLAEFDSYRVKFQEILRDGESLVIARVKVPTPSGHAFLLRRLDTGAISLTTMFRAAFPSASSRMEEEECHWVKTAYVISGANRTGGASFAGTWVPTSVAQELAPSYRLNDVLRSLLEAELLPNTEFRRGSRTLVEQKRRSTAQVTSRSHRSDSPHAAQTLDVDVHQQIYAHAPNIGSPLVTESSLTDFLRTTAPMGRSGLNGYQGAADFNSPSPGYRQVLGNRRITAPSRQNYSSARKGSSERTSSE